MTCNLAWTNGAGFKMFRKKAQSLPDKVCKTPR